MDSAVRPEELCPEWTDDVRMRALFGPLPSQAAQAEARAGRLRFWTNLIDAWAAHPAGGGNRALITVQELRAVLARAGRSPQCLGEVAAAGLAAGLYAQPAAYLNQREQQSSGTSSWGSWLAGLGTGAVQSVGALLLGGGGQPAVLRDDQEFVVVSQAAKLEEQCLKVIMASPIPAVVETCSARYLREADLLASLSAVSRHPSTTHYMLTLLTKTGRVAAIPLGQTLVYKVTKSTAAAKGDSGGIVVTVDEVDRGVLQLQASLDLLAAQVATVDQQMASEKVAAKEAVRLGSRPRARACLQRQKRAERRLAVLLQQQANMETILEQILQAETNSQVVSAYQSGLAALKPLLKGPEATTAEAVEATMAEVAELMEDADEISQTLASSGSATAEEEAELEDELAAMLQQLESDKKKEEEAVPTWLDQLKEPTREETALLDRLKDLAVEDHWLEPAAGDMEPVIGGGAAVRQKKDGAAVRSAEAAAT